MKYRDSFDHLGNPVAKPLDTEGIWIVVGCVIAVIIVALWMRN
jgi:hypothetical protein